jgi:hypothetical protein
MVEFETHLNNSIMFFFYVFFGIKKNVTNNALDAEMENQFFNLSVAAQLLSYDIFLKKY